MSNTAHLHIFRPYLASVRTTDHLGLSVPILEMRFLIAFRLFSLQVLLRNFLNRLLNSLVLIYFLMELQTIEFFEYIVLFLSLFRRPQDPDDRNLKEDRHLSH